MTRDIARVLTFSALTQVAGFGKSILIAYYFGVGAELDGYYLAQAIPALFSSVSTVFLQTGLLTVYVSHLAQGEGEAAAALLARILLALTALGIAVSVVVSASAPTLVSLIAPDASASIQDSAVTSLRILAFLLLLNALVDCLALILSAQGFFAVAALAPIVNAVVASLLLVYLPNRGLETLIWGTLIGVVAQLLLVGYETRRRGIKLAWRVSVSLRPIFLAGAAIIPGVLFAHLANLVPQIVAARLGDGAIATFSFAMRLHGAATQVLAVALSTVFLPSFAHAAGRGEFSAISAQLKRSFPVVALISISMLLWVGLVGESLVSLAFERGAFDRSASASVASVWFWLTVGLLPTIWGALLAKALQALRLGSTISLTALLGLAMTISGCLILSGAAGLPGLALAMGIASLCMAIASAIAVAKPLGVHLRLPARTAFKSLIAMVFTAVAGVALHTVDVALHFAPKPLAPAVITLCIAVGTGLGLRFLLRRNLR